MTLLAGYTPSNGANLSVLCARSPALFELLKRQFYLIIYGGGYHSAFAGLLFRMYERIPDDDGGGGGGKNRFLVYLSVMTLTWGACFILETIHGAMTGRYTNYDRFCDWAADIDRSKIEQGVVYVEDIYADIMKRPGRGWGPFPVDKMRCRDPDAFSRFEAAPRHDYLDKKELMEDIFFFTEDLVKSVVNSGVCAAIGPIPIDRSASKEVADKIIPDVLEKFDFSTFFFLLRLFVFFGRAFWPFFGHRNIFFPPSSYFRPVFGLFTRLRRKMRFWGQGRR